MRGAVRTEPVRGSRSMKAALWVCALAAPCIAVRNMPPALAQIEEYVPGAWHYRSVACVKTTVTSVEPRLVAEGQTKFSAQDFENGVDVRFKTHLGADPAHPHMFASVTHYGGLPGNEIMFRERPGDKVQVCFLSRPAPTDGCNPDQDERGRVYRVYDYRQHEQYSGMNTEHGCGGA
jgi:hypothetical protein